MNNRTLTVLSTPSRPGEDPDEMADAYAAQYCSSLEDGIIPRLMTLRAALVGLPRLNFEQRVREAIEEHRVTAFAVSAHHLTAPCSWWNYFLLDLDAMRRPRGAGGPRPAIELIVVYTGRAPERNMLAGATVHYEHISRLKQLGVPVLQSIERRAWVAASRVPREPLEEIYEEDPTVEDPDE